MSSQKASRHDVSVTEKPPFPLSHPESTLLSRPSLRTIPVGPTRVYVYWESAPNLFDAWRLRAVCTHSQELLCELRFHADEREAWLEVPPNTFASLTLFGLQSNGSQRLGELSFATAPTAAATDDNDEGGWVRWGSTAFVDAERPSESRVPFVGSSQRASSHRLQRTP